MANIDYTISLTETEDKALAYVAYSQQEWIDNAIHERCRLAIDDIVRLTVQKCLEEQVQIPSTKEEIVQLAYDKGWVKAASDITDAPVT